MPLRNDLLNPIPGDNPSGANLRYDPVMDKIKEARREDVDVPQGAWKTAVKTADFKEVVKLASDVIAKRSKDLQVAVWLVEAHIRREGLALAGPAFQFICDLLDQFWDTLYPELEDGDPELRAGPLDWLGSKLDFAIRNAPLTSSGFSFVVYQESRLVGYEADVANDFDKQQARQAKIDGGKASPEQFDEAVDATPMSFYAATLSSVNDALAAIEKLNDFCDSHFGEDGPSFGNTRKAFEDVQHLLEIFLRKKGGAVAVPGTEEEEEEQDTSSGASYDSDFSFALDAGNVAPDTATDETVSDDVDASSGGVSLSELTSESDVVAQLSAICKYLRDADPTDASAYVILRAYHWGKLRNQFSTISSDDLVPPSSELRQKLKTLHKSLQFSDLLNACEEAMTEPCAGAWFDLHRYACHCLDQSGLGAAIRGIEAGVRSLLQDMPVLMDLHFQDETPLMSAHTKEWIDGLLNPPAPPSTDDSSSSSDSDSDSSSDFSFDSSSSTDDTSFSTDTSSDSTDISTDSTDSFGTSDISTEPSEPEMELPPLEDSPPVIEPEVEEEFESTDEFKQALKAVKKGDVAEGLRSLYERLASERSNRGRFRRRTQIAHVLLEGNHPKVAAPLLEQLATEIDDRHLEEWEEGPVVAYPLYLLLHSLKKETDHAERRKEIYARLCKIDPVRAVGITV